MDANERRPTEGRADGWWGELETEILAVLADGAKSPGEIGDALGMSEHAITSLLSMLAAEGHLRIRLVEAVSPGRRVETRGAMPTQAAAWAALPPEQAPSDSATARAESM